MHNINSDRFQPLQYKSPNEKNDNPNGAALQYHPYLPKKVNTKPATDKRDRMYHCGLDLIVSAKAGISINRAYIKGQEPQTNDYSFFVEASKRLAEQKKIKTLQTQNNHLEINNNLSEEINNNLSEINGFPVVDLTQFSQPSARAQSDLLYLDAQQSLTNVPENSFDYNWFDGLWTNSSFLDCFSSQTNFNPSTPQSLSFQNFSRAPTSSSHIQNMRNDHPSGPNTQLQTQSFWNVPTGQAHVPPHLAGNASTTYLDAADSANFAPVAAVYLMGTPHLSASSSLIANASQRLENSLLLEKERRPYSYASNLEPSVYAASQITISKDSDTIKLIEKYQRDKIIQCQACGFSEIFDYYISKYSWPMKKETQIKNIIRDISADSKIDFKGVNYDYIESKVNKLVVFYNENIKRAVPKRDMPTQPALIEFVFARLILSRNKYSSKYEMVPANVKKAVSDFYLSSDRWNKRTISYAVFEMDALKQKEFSNNRCSLFIDVVRQNLFPDLICHNFQQYNDDLKPAQKAIADYLPIWESKYALTRKPRRLAAESQEK